MTNRIKALCFDVFGTVVDWRSSIIAEGESLNDKMGWNTDWAAFADQWRGMYQPSMEQVRSGKREWAILDILHRESLDKLIEEHHLDGLDEVGKAHLNRVWHRLTPWPDSVEGLTRLKTRFTLATLSNGNISLLANMAKRSALPWDAILGAEVGKQYKPRTEPYIVTAGALGVRRAQCLMVAAHNSDLVVAGGLGFKTAFVARPTEYGPGQQQDLKAEHDFDYIAKDLIDLARQLGCNDSAPGRG